MTSRDVVLTAQAPSPARPKSRMYTRLSQAQAALAIKDEDTGESEIDKRLGLAVVQRPSGSPKLDQDRSVSFRAGSTGSTYGTSSSSGTSNANSTDGSVYGGVVLRPVSRPRTVTEPVKSELKSDDIRDRGFSLPPPKPVRQIKPAMAKQISEPSPSPPSSQVDLDSTIREPSPDTQEKIKSKRKRYSSADFLKKTLVQQGEKKSEKKEKGPRVSDVGESETKRRNRLSNLLYSSMRAGRGSTKSKENSAGSDPGGDNNQGSKALRLLEEETCQDPQQLLACRVRELRKVANPDAAAKPQNDREDFPLFEFVCEVSVRRKSEHFCPYISWSHPPLRVLEEEQDRLASITSLPMFCFPDVDLVEQVKKMKTETYCFVFTDLQAQNKFGYCRRFLPAPKLNPPEKRFPVVYCMVTKLRSFETFSKIFDQVVELRDFSSAGAYSFLKALIEQNAPKPAQSITVKYINAKVGNLVDIHVDRVTADQRFEHVDLVYVLNKLGSKLLVEIFINLLVEKKLLFVAENLSDLTTIIHSIMQLLYPLHWQGIYIPVLPQEIIDATSSPVPFVIGILKQHSKLLDAEALDDECNIVYITEKKIVKRPNFTDIPFNKKCRKRLLSELKAYKAKVAKLERSTPEETAEIGDMFFQFMRICMGHYQDHVTFDEAGQSDIDLTSFSDAAGLHAEFVWHISKTQMFSSFVQGLTSQSVNPFKDEGG